jgi:carbon storage regulator CsrA
MPRLVLTRRLDECVIVHEDGRIIVTVKLCRIDRNSVRLAFVADPEVSIDREEIFIEATKDDLQGDR